MASLRELREASEVLKLFEMDDSDGCNDDNGSESEAEGGNAGMEFGYNADDDEFECKPIKIEYVEEPVDGQEEEEKEEEEEEEEEKKYESDPDYNCNEDLEVPPRKKRKKSPNQLRSQCGLEWSTKPPEARPVYEINYVKAEPAYAATPQEAWNILFTQEILNIIVQHTNAEISRQITKMKATSIQIRSYHKAIDIIELQAIIGLLYFAGLHKGNITSIRHLWSPYGLSLFRVAISEHRFMFLMYCICFDNKNTRKKRKATDKLANIRQIWDIFIANCRANYQPHSHLTVGEMLFRFRGKCTFRMYVPTKRDRYGLKIITLNDSTTHYMYNAIPHCGTVELEPNETLSSYYVRKITEPIYSSGRTVSCSSQWFVSVRLCKKMLEDYNVHLVGSLSKNKPEVPKEFKRISATPTPPMFAYIDNLELVSYCPNSKIGTTELVLSTLPTTNEVDKNGIPRIAHFHNNTKDSANHFETKCNSFTTSRKSHRWAMRFFYGMLDQAIVNSFIIYSSSRTNEKMKMSDYMLNLSLALVRPLLTRRLRQSSLRTSLRLQLEAILDCKDDDVERDPLDLTHQNKMPRHRRCGFCPSAIDRKTFYRCIKCVKPMCRDHTAKICGSCSQPVINDIHLDP